jgi:hypothetical protein
MMIYFADMASGLFFNPLPNKFSSSLYFAAVFAAPVATISLLTHYVLMGRKDFYPRESLMKNLVKKNLALLIGVANGVLTIVIYELLSCILTKFTESVNIRHPFMAALDTIVSAAADVIVPLAPLYIFGIVFKSISSTRSMLVAGIITAAVFFSFRNLKNTFLLSYGVVAGVEDNDWTLVDAVIIVNAKSLFLTSFISILPIIIIGASGWFPLVAIAVWTNVVTQVATNLFSNNSELRGFENIFNFPRVRGFRCYVGCKLFYGICDC